MKIIAHIVMLGILASGLTACGTKGKLKTPSQIEVAEKKKAAKEAKKKAEAEKAKQSDDDSDRAQEKQE